MHLLIFTHSILISIELDCVYKPFVTRVMVSKILMFEVSVNNMDCFSLQEMVLEIFIFKMC